MNEANKRPVKSVDRKTPLFLAYAGTLPFIFCAISLAFDIQTIPFIGETHGVLSAYSLVIVTFMAGSHWGQHLYLDSKWNLYLPLFSNILAVTMGLSYLILPLKTQLVFFIIAFVFLLFIDQRLFKDKLITRQYFYTRCMATFIVIASLIMSGIFI